MKYMSHNDIRKTWFDFFQKHGHKIIESAPLVPYEDDSLLWVNAGVTPLKKYFDGSQVPECRRLTSIQKCIRTNDIENVGVTKRHQTFFEMMGNFSIGDYFKEEAISFSYELLTSPEYFGIDKDLLYVTVYSTDDVARDKWVDVGISPAHIVRLKENFWEIGEGPCGPDSEIFFDRGEKYDPKGDALEKFKNDEEQERYVEIWNNVFSQFNSKEGVKREDYKELPSKNIDTGAGLERWCCIFQGVDSNFETDLFKPIIEHITALGTEEYYGQKEYKVIADHIRAITFALADGASFENVGRGYVLRRLLRRSVRFGKQKGLECPFMYKIVSSVIDTMKEAYPYLVNKREMIEKAILDEEKLFLKTLESGEKRLTELMNDSIDKTISGEDAFKLYDTYGFPFELTLEYLNDAGFSVSRVEFDKCMEEQKKIARAASKNKSAMSSQNKALLDFVEKEEFVYGLYRIKSKVTAIFSNEERMDYSEGDCYIALDRTCFYAESGGQVSDTGMIVSSAFKARVIDVFKAPNGQHIHKVKLLDGAITVGDECETILDKDRREKIEINHSSVHILQYALQQVISSSIKQAGSYVDDEKLRFDFTYSGKVTDEMVLEVEKFIKDMCSKNLIVSTEVMPLDKAKQLGAMALFSEKYGEVVRVVKIGKSIELCGGTHTSNTKLIQDFAIFSLENKGSNVYRIEAATNSKVEKNILEVIKPYHDEIVKLLVKAKTILEHAKEDGIKLSFDIDMNNDKPTSYKDLILIKEELSTIAGEVKSLEKKYLDLREKKSLENLGVYEENIKDYNGVLACIMEVYNKDVNLLKTIADNLVQKMDKGIVFLANVKNDNSVNFICRSKCNLHAGVLVKDASILSDGNGGGSPTFAQGGGKNTSHLTEIFANIKKALEDEK